MNLRFDMAKLLLAQKYSHLITELEKKATEQHNADTDEWGLILDGISFAEDVPQLVFSFVNFLPFVDPTFIAPAIPSSTLFTHFFSQLDPMLTATSRSLLEMLMSLSRMVNSSQREYICPFLQPWSITDFLKRVHWWPGDRRLTKDWTQWNEEAFNSGVAVPFLAYAKDTSESHQCVGNLRCNSRSPFQTGC